MFEENERFLLLFRMIDGVLVTDITNNNLLFSSSDGCNIF
jgi:hypothetical protein